MSQACVVDDDGFALHTQAEVVAAYQARISAGVDSAGDLEAAQEAACNELFDAQLTGARARLLRGKGARGWLGGRKWKFLARSDLSAGDVLLANLAAVDDGQSERVRPKLVDNDQRLSEAIGSAEEGAAREKQAREFFAAHGIDVSGRAQGDVVRVYDRVKQVAIGAGCEEWQSLVYQLAYEHDAELAYTKEELGLCSTAVFDIRLIDEHAPPSASKPYKCSESDRQFLAREVAELVRLGILEPCVSPWAFPAICAHRVMTKPSGEVVDKRRMVFDFRPLNRRTVNDAYPMPDCDGTLARLKGANYYACLDVKSGFWQLGLTERAREYSVVVTPDGQYRCRRMLQGLKNAPACFQRTMSSVLGDLVGSVCLVYIDDVVVWGATPEEVLENTRAVMSRMAAAGLRLNGAKCCFLAREIELLGHRIIGNQLMPQTHKLEGLKQQRPRTIRDVQSILGVLGYFRKFIRHYADIVKPVRDVISAAERRVRGAQSRLTAKQRAAAHGRLEVDWTPAAAAAVATLVDRLHGECWLVQPDPELEYVLYTDYSGIGIGGCLMQRGHDGVERPVTMVSRSLTEAEQRYPPIEGEALALIWTIDRLRHLIEGVRVLVRTDHRPLVYIFRNEANKSKLSRWALKLQSYDLQIEYIEGKANVLADHVSRAPVQDVVGLADEEAFDLSGSQLPTSGMYTAFEEYRAEYNEQLAARACPACGGRDGVMVLCDRCGSTWHPGCAELEQLPPRYWYCQACSEVIRSGVERDVCYDDELLQYLHLGTVDDESQRPRLERAARFLRYDSARGLQVYRDGRWLSIPPPNLRAELAQERHVMLRHAGAHAVTQSLRRDFYWTRMYDLVRAVLRECDACQKARAEFVGKNVELHPTEKGYLPFAHWSLDLMPDIGVDNVTLLVCVCTFSKWVELVVLARRDAGTVWDAFFETVVCRYGVPLSVRVDQGNEFKGAFTAGLEAWGINVRRASVKYPQANGQSERYVHLVKQALRKYTGELPEGQWRPYIGEILLALRCLVHRAHGFSPYFTVFGREVDLPSILQRDQVEVGVALTDEEMVELAERFADRMSRVRDVVRERLVLYDQRAKRYYDATMRDVELPDYSAGDLVLLRQRRAGGLRLPATGPYRFLRYRSASKLTATIEHPLTGKQLPVPVSHLLPYKGKAPEPVLPRVERQKSRKRARLQAFVAAVQSRSGQQADWAVRSQAASVGRWWARRGLWRSVSVDVAGLALIETLLVGQQPSVVTCTRCGFLHTDVGWFAAHASYQKLCGGCGELFRVSQRCIANALAVWNPYLVPKLVGQRPEMSAWVRGTSLQERLTERRGSIGAWCGDCGASGLGSGSAACRIQCSRCGSRQQLFSGLQPPRVGRETSDRVLLWQVAFRQDPLQLLAGGTSALRPYVLGSDTDLLCLESRFRSPWKCEVVVRLALAAMMDGSRLVAVECLGCSHYHVCRGCGVQHFCRRCGSALVVGLGEMSSPLALMSPRLHDGRLVLG